MNLVNQFRSEILARDRAVPKAVALDQLHQIVSLLLMENGSKDNNSLQNAKKHDISVMNHYESINDNNNSLQNVKKRDESKKNYSMLGMNYTRTWDRLNALADDEEKRSQRGKLENSLQEQKEKIDASGPYRWEGEKPVYLRVGDRK